MKNTKRFLFLALALLMAAVLLPVATFASSPAVEKVTFDEELIEAKLSAAAQINALAGDIPSDAVQAIADTAISKINSTKSIDTVNALLSQALSDIEAQQAAEAFASYKTLAIYDVDVMKVETVSAEATAILDAARAKLVEAQTYEEVDAAVEGLEEAVTAKETEFQRAKAAAIAELEALAGNDSSAAVQAMVDNAIGDIEKTECIEEVNTIKLKASENISAQQQSEQTVKKKSFWDKLMDAFNEFLSKISKFFRSIFQLNLQTADDPEEYLTNLLGL